MSELDWIEVVGEDVEEVNRDFKKPPTLILGLIDRFGKYWGPWGLRIVKPVVTERCIGCKTCAKGRPKKETLKRLGIKI